MDSYHLLKRFSKLSTEIKLDITSLFNLIILFLRIFYDSFSEKKPLKQLKNMELKNIIKVY